MPSYLYSLLYVAYPVAPNVPVDPNMRDKWGQMRSEGQDNTGVKK